LVGSKFTNTLLLAKALSVSGGPVIVKSLKEMGETYKKTRAALKQELPNILQAKGDIEALKNRVAELGDALIRLNSEFKAGKIDMETLRAKEDAIRKEISEIRASFVKIDALQGGVAHLMSTIDPNHIKTVVGQMYTCLLAGAAAVSSQTAGVVTMGLNIGRVINGFLEKLLTALKGNIESNRTVMVLEEIVVENNSAWWKTASQTVAHASGMIAAYFLKRTAAIVSACALGSKMVAEATEEVLDPLLIRLSLPTLKGNPSVSAALQSGALAYGVISQLKPGGGRMPAVVRLLMSPVLFIEAMINMLLIK
jgi:uridylate kinase